MPDYHIACSIFLVAFINKCCMFILQFYGNLIHQLFMLFCFSHIVVSENNKYRDDYQNYKWYHLIALVVKMNDSVCFMGSFGQR